ncbi:MAG: hypothetical protein ACLR7U_13165 [Ruthenibacterium lactatiformans]
MQRTETSCRDGCHSGREGLTMLYALADQLTAAKLEGKGGHLHE